MDAKRIISGTFGECWMDDDYLAEAFGLQAKIDITKEDVQIAGKLSKSKKITGWEGKGSVKLNKVNSRMAKKIASMLKDGKEVRVKIISKLADPDSFDVTIHSGTVSGINGLRDAAPVAYEMRQGRAMKPVKMPLMDVAGTEIAEENFASALPRVAALVGR